MWDVTTYGSYFGWDGKLAEFRGGGETGGECEEECGGFHDKLLVFSVQLSGKRKKCRVISEQ